MKKLKVHVIKREHRHSQADKVNYTLGGCFFNAAGTALVIPINSPRGPVDRELKAFRSERLQSPETEHPSLSQVLSHKGKAQMLRRRRRARLVGCLTKTGLE